MTRIAGLSNLMKWPSLSILVSTKMVSAPAALLCVALLANFNAADGQILPADFTEVTTTGGTKSWLALASSDDGEKVVAGAFNENLWTSADAGATWSEVTTTGAAKQWTALASSADGEKVVAGANDGNLWTSADAGATWSEVTTTGGPKGWRSLASSDDGEKVVAGAYRGNLWTSADAGATWSEVTTNGATKQWYSVASSADGMKVVAGVYFGNLWTSTDAGATWSEVTTTGGPKAWLAVALSDDGEKLVAGMDHGNLWTSADAGATWSEVTTTGPTRRWVAFTYTGDLSKLVAAAFTGHLWAGGQFTTQPPATTSPTPSPTPPGDAPDDYACRTSMWVKYTQPVAGPRLGPIVLGRGANGAAISLYPGTFTASSEVYVCNGATNLEMANAAYRGEANVVYDGSSSMSIVIYAIDVRQPLNEASLENFAPLITSIQINAQTLDVGETATIKATGYDFNAADTLKKMALSVFDTTDGGDISREDGSAADAMVNSFTSGRMNTATLEFTPAVPDFTDSNASAHRLLATVTATDSFDAEGNGQVPLTVNRLVGVKIGAVTFNRPRVSLDVNKQFHSSVAGASTEAAVAKFDIFDADSVVPYPYPEYRESHTYHIESIAAPVNAIAPADVAVGANFNNFPTPGNCFGGECQYTECVCTRSAVADDDGNFGCNEINATKAGDEWTFTWNPWSGVDSRLYGVTFCELKVHFVDNTASVSRTGSVTQAIEGLTTQTATILLEANPGAFGLNFPPAISLFYAAHIYLAPDNTENTTVTVIFEDAESASPPDSEFGYLGLGCVTPDEESCFVPIVAVPTQTPLDPTPAGQAGAWEEVYTFNGNTALRDASGSTLKVYLKLTDADDSSMVGYHEMATLTRLEARRRRRRQDSSDAAAPRTAGMTISIDENGRLTGQMEFPAGAVVSVDVDTAGGSTGAPDRHDDDRGDDHGDDRGDDHIRTDDGSPDRRLVMIMALAGGVGCCCLLGAAICLGYAMLRRNGTARVGPSPTRRPTKILVSGAAPGLGGPRKDPFAGFQTA